MSKLFKGLFLLAITTVSLNSYAGEYPKGAIKLVGEYNDASVNKVIEDIDKAFKGKPKGFTLDLYLNSPGGEVFAGNRLIHSIMRAQSAGYKVRGIVTGQCMSMCFITLQYLDNRVAYPHAWIMDHDVSGGDNKVALNAVSEVHRAVVAGRLKVNKDLYRSLVHRELWMSTRTAIAYGVLDGIVIPGKE